jgi:hypothetical protein
MIYSQIQQLFYIIFIYLTSKKEGKSPLFFDHYDNESAEILRQRLRNCSRMASSVLSIWSPQVVVMTV